MKALVPLKVLIPLVLGIIVSLAIAVYEELGTRRLEVANRQMAVALEMQATLHQALSLVVDAETGQRGYMLTGRSEYLQPYKDAVPRIDGAFSRLGELLVSNGTQQQRDRAGRFNNLVGRKMAELETTIALFDAGDHEGARKLLETGIGKRTMEEIRADVDAMATSHRQQINDASSLWTRDLEVLRLGMQLMTASTVALLLIVWLLARRDAQQREVRRQAMLLEQRRLESIVDDRTAALSELSNHLQAVREDEKAKLARDIHDELGGILVSAKMDVAWVEDRLKAREPESAKKLERALQALDDGVEIKRRIIEELRPTLLDNLGLSAAVEWQVHEICDRAGLESTIECPSEDSGIPPQISIAVYRILQEALTNIVKYANARHVGVDLGLTSRDLTLIVEDNGVGIADSAQHNRLSHGISGMRQRVRALHGEFAITRRPAGGTTIEVNIPLHAQPQGVPVTVPEPAQDGSTAGQLELG